MILTKKIRVLAFTGLITLACPGLASAASAADRDIPPVFFPPSAPIYGMALANASLVQVRPGQPFEPPDRLGDYVGEFFYPALSTRLFAGPLDQKLASRLEAYIANRAGLLNELQDALVALPATDPATRERELRAFAAVQTPRIAAHEAEGEQLRQKLINDGLLSASVDWSKHREWKLGDPHLIGRLGTLAEFQVIRAAVYYQKGLIPEQRGLLSEVAEKLSRQLPMGMRPSVADPMVIYFSPETSRLRLPPLPAALNSKLGAYTMTREALKEELWNAVVEHDKSSLKARAAAFETLADRQWPRLVALADLAEEIRRDLVALPPPPMPPLPPGIPPDLASRIEECIRDKNALDQERSDRLRSLAPLPPLVNEIRGRPQDLVQVLQARSAERQKARAAADADFRKENADRYAALEANLKSLAIDLLAFARTHTDPVSGKPMDVKTLLRRVNASEQYFEREAREEVLYKNYKVAMLEPGLSPEQRRLLFGAARVGLAQALPPGQTLPSGNIPSLR
jgi:hypothetical protein